MFMIYSFTLKILNRWFLVNMQKAAIIIVGNEFLSGRTLDKNSNFICARCSLLGIQVVEENNTV